MSHLRPQILTHFLLSRLLEAFLAFTFKTSKNTVTPHCAQTGRNYTKERGVTRPIPQDGTAPGFVNREKNGSPLKASPIKRDKLRGSALRFEGLNFIRKQPEGKYISICVYAYILIYCFINLSIFIRDFGGEGIWDEEGGGAGTNPNSLRFGKVKI
jgi:hypothetical protein